MTATQQVLLGASPLSFATWNPADKAASIALSGGDLTATGAAAVASVRATQGKSSGKWFWEVACTGGSFGYFGVADSTHGLGFFIGEDGNHGWAYRSTGTKVSNFGATVAYGATWGSGDIIGIALDMDAGTIEFYTNGVSQGVAFTALSGTLYPAVGIGASSGTSATINFGAISFAYPISGYQVMTA